VDRPKKISYFGMPSPGYPRNKRIREYLESIGYEVVVTDSGVDHAGLAGKLRRLASLFSGSRGATAIVVAEFATKYALPALLIARFRGARLVVDGFVGIYETEVEDWKSHSAGSFHAWLYRIADWLAVRCADVYLIDTRIRAEAINRAYRVTKAVSLPVGAPEWAASVPAYDRRDRVLRMLYYGNYIALHGVDTILEAVSAARVGTSIELTMVGDGRLKPAAERQVLEAGLSGVVTFVPPVPEHDLPSIIAEHEVVLGIFGTSNKAGSVIANKVWQGLASGRVVVTQQSAALDEIRTFVAAQLRVVPAGDSNALAETIRDIIATPQRVEPDAPQRLEAYVRGQFESLAIRLA
jgi:glycosyltransferase involved in cell wall biosynthesis